MHLTKISYLLFAAFLLASCGSSVETTTVQSDTSELLSTSDSLAVEEEEDTDEFIQLKLGEIAPIHSLDPLFATSNSELRAINLVYEQLIGLNQFGNPAPELAKRWEVNSDSTQFTLHLRTDIYFHNSPAFESGNGRRFIASDVRFVFERMASNEVPSFTAQTFSDILGFNAYHSEQTLIKNPEKRVIEKIEGLRVRNDSTVTFILEQPSSDFLQRLAHPQASIYPRESVPGETGIIQQAAGTGRFQFIKKEGNAHLFTINDDFRGVTPNLNRLDIVSGLEEKDLYQEFARSTFHALIEVSFPTLQTITDSTGNLIPQFSPIYKLRRTGVNAVHTLYYNEESGQATEVSSLLDSLDARKLIRNPNWGEVEITTPIPANKENSSNRRMLISTQNQHFNERMLINNLANVAAGSGFSFTMNASYAPTNFTTFTSLNYEDTQPVIRWFAPIYILYKPKVKGITIKNFPWELDLNAVEFSEDL